MSTLHYQQKPKKVSLTFINPYNAIVNAFWITLIKVYLGKKYIEIIFLNVKLKYIKYE